MPYGPTPWGWRVGSRYGRSYVDKYIRGDERHILYETIPCSSRKQAQEIANALNSAFNEGVRYGAQKNQEIHTCSMCNP